MNKWIFSVPALLLLVLSLSGCSQDGSASGSFFKDIFIAPMSASIEFSASLLHGNYGLSIIFMTLIIRLVLMPLSLKQMKTQSEMKQKMEGFKPELTALQNKIKTEKDLVKRKKHQQEMAGLYQKHGVNPLNMGCLPVLIQMPILMGFYYAIKGSQHIASHSFLWFNLGHADHILAVVAGIIYYLQFRVSLKNMPVEQQNSMKLMGLMSPAMILLFSFNAPAALPLYWSVGGLFLMLQTELGRRLTKNTKKPLPAQEPVTPVK
ncbi:membrane protein insertase YidC [Peribacillus deserti]|uniref:Membrane protein insertase YidC n=1 Tax=Peribacillus deserti TaxID=673318 RepID=A0A2N5LZU9_9BACI|nr:membrane protein insertase YidC [Peribacillus deserti]PLT27646.1 OxaA precursor [Peribacillus deserti]